MKNSFSFYRYFFLLPLCLVSVITGCKKSAEHSGYDSIFSFTYNGKKYILPYKEGTAEWSVVNGIYINRPDIFNGIINYPYPGCGYFEPSGTYVDMELNYNCRLSSHGRPIDSIAVYLYESGLVTRYFNNCSSKKEYDIFSGRYFSYQVCDIDGTFNLVLKNKQNKTITITDGEFHAYRYRTY